MAHATGIDPWFIAQIQGIVGDATTLDPGALRPDSALVTMVLHHTDDPPGIFRSVARLLPSSALAVVADLTKAKIKP